MLAIPPFGASSNIALWRANIKPPVELVVDDLGLDVNEYANIMEYLEIPRSRKEIQEFCGYKSRDSFVKNILNPLITSGKVDLLFPDKPNSPKR